MNFEELAKSGMDTMAMYEAVGKVGAPKVAPKPEPVIPAVDQELAMYEAIEQNALTNTRALGMSAVIAWATYGEPTAEDFDATAQGMSDIDEDGEVSEFEEEQYNEVLFSMAQALMSMNVSSDDVAALLDGDDRAASVAYVAIAEKVENSDLSEDEIVAEFSVQETVMTEAKVKVIRDGQTKWVKKPLKKRRMSAAQRAALKKARMRSNTAGARAKRKKSMRKRQSAGL
jgi:hypothetical protein